MESVVEKEIHTSTHIRHVATESLGRIRAKLHPVDIHPVVGSENILKARNFIILIAFPGHRSTGKRSKSLTARLVERTGRVTAHSLPVFLIKFDILVNS